MLAEVRRTIRREHMLHPGEPLWVGVSGGVDSMVLLHVLCELGHPCHVAHVDHGLRGAESDADLDFVQEHARREGLPFRSVRVDPKAFADGISVQMAARNLRYAWFKELLREGPSVMALGHHRDDVVETLLLNLLRGIGSHGWSAIPAVTTLAEGRICRPLLSMGREQVRAYAEAKGIQHREDASNTDRKYLRNRVRLELLPLMEAMRPGARRTMARAAEVLKELGAAAEQQLTREAEGGKLDPDGTTRIPLAGLRESATPRLLLMRALHHLSPHPDLIDQLLEAILDRSVGARFHAGNQCITVERDGLSVGRPVDGFPSFAVPLAATEQGGAGPFSWSICLPPEVEYAQGMNTAWLDVDRLEFPLLLRPWREGDRMRPVGLGGTKLISDILTDAGVTRSTKAETYVLLSGNTIVWLVGHRIAEGHSPVKSTKEVLRIAHQPRSGSPSLSIPEP